MRLAERSIPGSISTFMCTIVVIGGSAGGLAPLRQIVRAFRPGTRASVFVVIHTGANPSQLPTLLERDGTMPVSFGSDGEQIVRGRIYVAPPDRHMLLTCSHIRLSHGAKVHFTRPSVDPLFASAADAFGSRVVGVVLSGGGGDGTEGLRAIKRNGGAAFVQDPEEAMVPSMPYTAMMSAHPDGCMSIELLARRVSELSR